MGKKQCFLFLFFFCFYFILNRIVLLPKTKIKQKIYKLKHEIMLRKKIFEKCLMFDEAKIKREAKQIIKILQNYRHK